MTRDEELWGAAIMILKRHGTAAPRFVAERIGALALSGDIDGVEAMRKIAQRVDRLLSQVPSA